MSDLNKNNYKEEVVNRLAAITLVLQKISAGDLTAKIKIPKKKDEFTEFLSVLNSAIDNFRQVKDINERYKDLISISFDGFFVNDLQGKLLDVDNVYCNLIGYGRDELLKMKVSDLEAVESLGEILKHIEKVKKIGGDYFETKHRAKNGAIINVEVNAIYDKSTEKRIFSFIRNITARKNTEEKLRLRTQEIEKINRLLVGRELKMIELKRKYKELGGH